MNVLWHSLTHLLLMIIKSPLIKCLHFSHSLSKLLWRCMELWGNIQMNLNSFVSIIDFNWCCSSTNLIKIDFEWLIWRFLLCSFFLSFYFILIAYFSPLTSLLLLLFFFPLSSLSFLYFLSSLLFLHSSNKQQIHLIPPQQPHQLQQQQQQQWHQTHNPTPQTAPAHLLSVYTL